MLQKGIRIGLAQSEGRKAPHPQWGICLVLGNNARPNATRTPQPSSTPPTRTAIFSGNGDTSELVIGGTAVRPCSDEVCASIVRRLFDSVAARFLSNCRRSAQYRVQQECFFFRLCVYINTLFGLGLAYLRVDDPVSFVRSSVGSGRAN